VGLTRGPAARGLYIYFELLKLISRTCLTRPAYLSTIPLEFKVMKRSMKPAKRATADKRSKRILADDRKDTKGSC